MTSTTTKVAAPPSGGTWTRINGSHLRFTGPPQEWGRDLLDVAVVRLKDTGRHGIRLAIATLDPGDDLADSDDLDDACIANAEIVLPADALVYLSMALQAVIKAEGVIDKILTDGPPATECRDPECGFTDPNVIHVDH